jgi:hypothetical protein
MSFASPKISRWVLGAPSSLLFICGMLTFRRGVKWPGSEAKHLHSSDVEVNNAWNCISTAPWVFVLHKYNFNFYFPVFYVRKSLDFILKKEEHGLTLCSRLSGITQLETMLSGGNAGSL